MTELNGLWRPARWSTSATDAALGGLLEEVKVVLDLVLVPSEFGFVLSAFEGVEYPVSAFFEEVEVEVEVEEALRSDSFASTPFFLFFFLGIETFSSDCFGSSSGTRVLP